MADEKNTMTQEACIREWLMEHRQIDRPTALRLCGCDRLGARIFRLRNDPKRPMNLRTERVKKISMFGNTTTVAVYHYEPEDEENG